MAPDNFQESPLAKALQREKELQEIIKRATDTIKAAMQELEKLKQFREMYRSFSKEAEGEKEVTPAASPVSSVLKGAAWGNVQEVFQSFVLDILRDVGRPLKSTEFIEEFRKRGHPLGGNEVRTAWNRLWRARASGVLTHIPKLGYWIPGEPLSKEAEEKALIAAKQTRRRSYQVPVRELARGKKKGPPPALTAEQVMTAEKMLLAGRTLQEVAALFGVAIRTLTTRLPGGGIAGLKAKYPDVVIPKRPYVHRPPRPGHKPAGRPRTITAEQEQQIGDLRSRGKSVSEIADATGIKRSTVYGYLKREQKNN